MKRNLKKNKIVWVIPDPVKGSGGLRTIFHLAFFLQEVGYEVHIYSEGRYNEKKTSLLIEKYFGYKFLNIHSGWSKIKSADMVIATIWYTAAFVSRIKFPCRKVYLVQDYEPLFFPVGDSYLLAENSYRYGLVPITIGKWLKHTLNNKFGINSHYFDFSADTHVYRPFNSSNKELSVCFLYQPNKPNRCAQFGIEALKIVKQLRPNTKIYLYGSSRKDSGVIPFEHQHLGILSISECNDLYNQASIGLSFSASNPSRVPFEMMSSGLPLLELNRENNLYDLPQDVIRFTELNSQDIAKNILELIDNSKLRKKMSNAGLAFMSGRSLDLEKRQFLSCIKNIFKEDKKYLSKLNPDSAEAEIRFNTPPYWGNSSPLLRVIRRYLYALLRLVNKTLSKV